MSIPVLLASAAVSELDEANRLVKEYRGFRCAGDAEDRLNADVLSEDEDWRVAWKGKVDAMLNPSKSGTSNY